MSSISDYSIGDRVVFGRSQGEQTLGTVVGKGRTKLKVRQDEARGAMKAHPVGTVWTVPVNLVIRTSAALTAVPATKQPAAPATKQPAAPATKKFTRGDKVAFTTKTGEIVTGFVTNTGTKTVSVWPIGHTNDVRWRVTPGLLRFV